MTTDSTTTRLPLALLPSFASVPSASDAPAVADVLRRCLGGPGLKDGPLLDVDALCKAAGVIATCQPLRGAVGGIEATLTPVHGDRFAVTVDPEPAGGWAAIELGVRNDLARQRYRFRVAHELGHTIFYDRSGSRPRRRLRVSAREEAFCDRFAHALLLPDNAVASREPTPSDVLDVQREYDVSLELCVRAFAEVHGESFFGLLVAKGDGAPTLRPQWTSATDLPARWWTAQWLQQALSQSCDVDRRGILGSGRTSVRCLWRALPHRSQVLVTASLWV